MLIKSSPPCCAVGNILKKIPTFSGFGPPGPTPNCRVYGQTRFVSKANPSNGSSRLISPVRIVTSFGGSSSGMMVRLAESTFHFLTLHHKLKAKACDTSIRESLLYVPAGLMQNGSNPKCLTVAMTFVICQKTGRSRSPALQLHTHPHKVTGPFEPHGAWSRGKVFRRPA